LESKSWASADFKSAPELFGIANPEQRVSGTINNVTLSQATSSDTTTVTVNGAFDAEK
jgi:hypothetical protein